MLNLRRITQPGISTSAAILLALAALTSRGRGAEFSLPLPDSGAVIARVGDTYIGEQEFLERYELLPAFGRHRAGQREAAKKELLASMIAERLLALAARSAGEDSSADVRTAMYEVRGMLARDALYKREIIRKVKVTPQELAEGIRQALRTRVVRFIWCASGDEAKFLRARITDARSFESLGIDTTLHAVRDTATVQWGNGDPGIEKSVYSLKQGAVSPVVETPDGYYIITLVSEGPNQSALQMMPEVLRDRVSTAIRRRKERARLDVYVAETLAGRNGHAIEQPMRRLADALEQTYARGTDSVLSLTPDRMDDLDRRCASFVRDTIAVAGGRSFQVGYVLERLRSTTFSIRRDALQYLPERLNTELKTIVQQELLAQEACRMGLDTLPDVREHCEMWKNAFLAGVYSDSVRRSAPPSEAEVWKYLRSRDSSVTIPTVRLRLLETTTAVEMQNALDLLGKGETLAEVSREWSNQKELREREGETGEFRVTDREPLGDIASRMNVGDRYGPVRTPQGYAYFELLGRSSAAADRQDTSRAALFATAALELQRMKGRRALTLRIAKLAKQYGVDVYEDRLRVLEVSPIPMMTFRILGFGGRMLPVPFVDPQLDWLEVGDGDRVLP
jgi:hypothetical protein